MNNPCEKIAELLADQSRNEELGFMAIYSPPTEESDALIVHARGCATCQAAIAERFDEDELSLHETSTELAENVRRTQEEFRDDPVAQAGLERVRPRFERLIAESLAVIRASRVNAG